MDSQVSDFKLAESIIRKFCRKYQVQFVDAPISFDEARGEALSINESRNIAHTIFNIVGEYIKKSVDITGVQFLPDESIKDDFLITLATNLRSFMYGEEVSDNMSDEPHLLRLYQCPLIWLLMKDIICPIYGKELKNIRLIAGGSPQIDIAKYYKKEDIPSEDISDEPFIFVNKINNRIIQNAFIFVETLKAYDLSPIEVIKDIYGTDLYDKFHGLLEIALDDKDDVDDFECTIMAFLGINFYSLISKKIARLNPNFIKIAQNSVPGLPNQFWYFGILEKMMEPARQSDWSVYKNLEPYIKDFWNKVEKVREKRVKEGHDNGVPFDLLLRIKSNQTTGYETDPTRTIQDLLSSSRVW